MRSFSTGAPVTGVSGVVGTVSEIYAATGALASPSVIITGQGQEVSSVVGALTTQPASANTQTTERTYLFGFTSSQPAALAASVTTMSASGAQVQGALVSSPTGVNGFMTLGYGTRVQATYAPVSAIAVAALISKGWGAFASELPHVVGTASLSTMSTGLFSAKSAQASMALFEVATVFGSVSAEIETIAAQAGVGRPLESVALDSVVEGLPVFVNETWTMTEDIVLVSKTENLHLVVSKCEPLVAVTNKGEAFLRLSSRVGGRAS